MMITVVGGGQKPGENSTLRHDWYLEVSAGSLQELSPSDWRSRAPRASGATDVAPWVEARP
jgi:hypothetical protein